MQKNTMEYLIAGIDEAGRGPLAGPVVAAAVILHPEKQIRGLADSKILTAKKRESLYERIFAKALAVGVGVASVEEIDKINILHASMLAMQRAFHELSIKPMLALIDGNRCPELPCETKAIIQGDQLEKAISAASIIAKVTRDREMVALDKQFPHYGFAKHKGYSTEEHLLALEKHGKCVLHRKFFRPVARVSQENLELELA